MPHVLTYWRFPAEEARFVEYLATTGDILACADERVSDRQSPRLEPRPVWELVAGEEPEYILLGPREFMDMAPIDAFESGGRVTYGRHYMCVPLLAYSRGVFRGAKRLGRSNLVFQSFQSGMEDGHVRAGPWPPQPPAFIAWGKRVLAWARRDAPRVVEHKRMTEEVFAELANGLELVP